MAFAISGRAKRVSQSAFMSKPQEPPCKIPWTSSSAAGKEPSGQKGVFARLKSLSPVHFL
eukprot:8954359-Karenia_brevis.AAC.1